jgi:pimeloyl-ACP methyl ester carboxylesterase
MIKPFNQEPVSRLETAAGDIAWRRVKGTGPTLLWLGGFLSDMSGSKVARLSHAARLQGWDFLAFDYFGHGETGGDWTAARIGTWQANVLAVADRLTEGPIVAIGSSMGGHMLCALIKARPGKVRAAGFVAPAPDFVTALMLPGLSPEERRQLDVSGMHMLSGYDRPVGLSQAFFDEAARHEVLRDPVPFDGPVRILHGMKDDTVPWTHGVRLLQTLNSNDVRLSLIKDGDHRLSRPQDLDLLEDMASELRGWRPGWQLAI